MLVHGSSWFSAGYLIACIMLMAFLEYKGTISPQHWQGQEVDWGGGILYIHTFHSRSPTRAVTGPVEIYAFSMWN
jgi:hypothetical protein